MEEALFSTEGTMSSECKLNLCYPHDLFTVGQTVTITDLYGSRAYTVKEVSPGAGGSVTYDLEPVTE